jgi:hypothetical protein
VGAQEAAALALAAAAAAAAAVQGAEVEDSEAVRALVQEGTVEAGAAVAV